MLKIRSRLIISHAACLASLLVCFLSTAMAADSDRQAVVQKAVLITGASSGIGRSMTELLASEGYFVYAGARKQKDLDELNALDNVEAVRLDVTIQDEIDAAVETVLKGGRGLYGLVNNAGTFTGGPLIETDIGELQWLFDVNVYGVYRVTQAFAPLIIESKGRIVNISSISGFGEWTMGGHYCMSKHAVEAYTDTLALEMARFGVGVSAIEPGNFKSNITKAGFARLAKKGVRQSDTRYAEEWDRLTSRPEDRSQFKDPKEVAEAALHALFDDKPKPHYLVVPDQEEAEWTIDAVVRKLVQLNERQPYSYSREQLIQMIDAAMAAAN